MDQDLLKGDRTLNQEECQQVTSKAKAKRKRATFSAKDLKSISEGIKEVRKMVRETTELVAKFKEAVSRPPVLDKKAKLSSFM
jgi:hypothetical protein